jgi:CheY-like chemotaxis protein
VAPAKQAKSLLVVEDSEIERVGLTVVLQGRGYRVAAVANGQEAIQFLRGDELPDMILLDMMMPVMDGWGFLHNRRPDPRLAAIPVILMTGLGVAGNEWAASLGAYACFRKPIDPDSLVVAIEAWPARRPSN